MNNFEISVEKKWHIVVTRQNWEKRICDALRRKNIEAFCPLTSHKKYSWHEKESEILIPAFPCHLFINVQHIRQFTLVQETKGVKNFLYRLSEPAIVSTADIKVIRTFLTLYENVSFNKMETKARTFQTGIDNGTENVFQFEGDSAERIFLPSIQHFITGRLIQLDKKILQVDSARLEKITRVIHFVDQREVNSNAV